MGKQLVGVIQRSDQPKSQALTGSVKELEANPERTTTYS